MCAISLQYDQHNPAAIKMLDAILEAGLFTICEQPALKKFTMEELNREMDQAELDAKLGHLTSASKMTEIMNSYVQEKIGL